MHTSKGHIQIEHSWSIGYGTAMCNTIPIQLAWGRIGPSWGTRLCLDLWEHHLGVANRSPLWDCYSNILQLCWVDEFRGHAQLCMQGMRRVCHSLVWVSRCANNPPPTPLWNLLLQVIILFGYCFNPFICINSPHCLLVWARCIVNRIKWYCTQIQYVMRPGLDGTSSLYPPSSVWCECRGPAQRCWQSGSEKKELLF